MKYSILVLLCISLALCAYSLDKWELEALRDIRSAWGAFSSTDRTWPEQVEEACNDPPFPYLGCTEGPNPHVLSLVINDSSATGQFFESIWGLRFLKYLDISNATIYGTIPERLGWLNMLEVLRLCSGPRQDKSLPGLVSSIPTTLATFNLSLMTMEFCAVDLTGSIPDFTQVGTIRHLSIKPSEPNTMLSLTGVLTTQIPKWNGLISIHISSTHLRALDLGFRSLQSLSLINNPLLRADTNNFVLSAISRLEIIRCPNVVGTLRLWGYNCDYIHLEDTGIWGPIAPHFWQLATTLRHFHISGTRLEGQLNASIGTFTRLQHLYIDSPGFYGSIPPEIGNCLALESLQILNVEVAGTLPSSIGSLPKLTTLRITKASNFGLVPSFIGNLLNLQHLVLKNCGLHGTLPSSFVDLTRLISLDLSFNDISGTIPSLTCLDCRLNNNNLTGTIPVVFGTHASVIHLQYNRLGPSLRQIFDNRRTILEIDISFNEFDDFLPDIYWEPSFSNHPILPARFSGNRFFGTIPASLAHYDLYLDSNLIELPLEPFLSQFKGTVLDLRKNFFRGSIPALSHVTTLREIYLDGNTFYGGIPSLPPNITIFSASVCGLNGTVDESFVSQIQSAKQLTTLDLSQNRFTCATDFLTLLDSSVKTLNFAFNKLNCIFSEKPTDDLPSFSQVSIDLTANQFSGPFARAKFPNLAMLKVSYNKLYGDYPFTSDLFPSLEDLDISVNLFSFDARLISRLPRMRNFYAFSNRIAGRLNLYDMPNLERLILDNNGLDEAPDMNQISFLMAGFLRVLSIQRNLKLPTISHYRSVNGLHTNGMNHPSKLTPGMVCNHLIFSDVSGSSFLYDEGLFNYTQCECDSKHFGLPPHHCYNCPLNSLGVDTCFGNSLRIAPNYFLIAPDNAGWNPIESKKRASSPEPVRKLHRFEVESCLVLPEQLLLGKSQCKGTNIRAENFTDWMASYNTLHSQCGTGAVGRLCSRCACDPEKGECYYERALECRKCSRIFTLSESLAILFGTLAALIIIGTTVMLLLLRNRRVQKMAAWENMPIYKRIFHRCLYLSSLGYVSILITFVQIFVELTRWDSFIIINWLQAINLNTEGLGLVCIFPALYNPTIDLVARIFTPFIFVILAIICIGFAELISRCFTSKSRKNAYRTRSALLSEENDNGEQEHGLIGASDSTNNVQGIGSSDEPDQSPVLGWTALSTHEKTSVSVHYPTLALLTSVSISIFKFFYFGAALTSHQFLFSQRQPYTETLYVQNLPWLQTEHALGEWIISIVMAFFFDVLIPVGFIVLCVLLRKKFSSPSVTKYVGNLFESFNPRCFWWEIVNILKKLIIALILRALPASNALQMTLSTSTLATLQITGLVLDPWKRKLENTFDSISALLLIGALLASRSGSLSHSKDSAYIILVLSALYVASLLMVMLIEALTGETEYQQRLKSWYEDHPDSKLPADSNIDLEEIHSSMQRFEPFRLDEESDDGLVETTDMEYEVQNEVREDSMEGSDDE